MYDVTSLLIHLISTLLRLLGAGGMRSMRWRYSARPAPRQSAPGSPRCWWQSLKDTNKVYQFSEHGSPIFFPLMGILLPPHNGVLWAHPSTNAKSLVETRLSVGCI
jgi:hypothetical protein